MKSMMKLLLYAYADEDWAHKNLRVTEARVKKLHEQMYEPERIKELERMRKAQRADGWEE